MSYGCLILSWIVRDGNGRINDIVLGLDKLEDYLKDDYQDQYPYFGVLVGRYANRIKNASFSLDGELVGVSANKGQDHIHGGLRGYDRAVWSVMERDATLGRVVFGYNSTDGAVGYHGSLEGNVAETQIENETWTER